VQAVGDIPGDPQPLGQLVGLPDAEFFSRIGSLIARVSTALRKTPAIVSATVSTPFRHACSLLCRLLAWPALEAGLFRKQGPNLAPIRILNATFSSFSASLPPRTLFLGAEVELLESFEFISRSQLSFITDAADFQHVP